MAGRLNIIRTHITGVGGYLPERVMTNKDLESIVDTDDAWIFERTGIRERHIIADGQHTSDLAAAAARQALEDAGLSVDDLDALIVATTTPDMIFPSTATIVQSKLGASGFPAWDIQAVCSGFVYGLAQADAMIRAGMFHRVLLIGAESMSRIMDWTDRSTCVLFGDGAGAVILEARDASEDGHGGVIGSVLKADGSYRPLLMARHPHPGASPDMPDMAVDAAGVAAVEMQGNEVFRNAVNKLGEVVGDVLAHCSMQPAEVDWLIPHQANIRIILATAKKLKLDAGHIAITVEKHANTSAASVPLALNSYYREGRIRKGQVLLLEAFGAGFVWGANLVRWSKD
ncbi:MAG: 3-oxoacyl-ACP synthase [Zetaproteobacteria bacterium CG2_30_59_37]|nr:MAG: 3-oxoacyl-ACP synthase [Zetaproteobacteria bacterium CG2_30_59_37]